MISPDTFLTLGSVSVAAACVVAVIVKTIRDSKARQTHEVNIGATVTVERGSPWIPAEAVALKEYGYPSESYSVVRQKENRGFVIETIEVPVTTEVKENLPSMRVIKLTDGSSITLMGPIAEYGGYELIVEALKHSRWNVVPGKREVVGGDVLQRVAGDMARIFSEIEKKERGGSR